MQLISLLVIFLDYWYKNKIIYFSLSFFLLNNKNGTRCTIKYILDIDLDPAKNWVIILFVHPIPWWSSEQ
jgi:hypothetical protein